MASHSDLITMESFEVIQVAPLITVFTQFIALIHSKTYLYLIIIVSLIGNLWESKTSPIVQSFRQKNGLKIIIIL